MIGVFERAVIEGESKGILDGTAANDGAIRNFGGRGDRRSVVVDAGVVGSGLHAEGPSSCSQYEGEGNDCGVMHYTVMTGG